MATQQQNIDSSTISHDRLGFAACIALALHAAIILGITFTQEDRSQAATKLEITLAQHSDKAPDEADFRAQANQQGSGTLEQKAMLTTREKADFVDNIIRQVSPQQQIRANQPSSTELNKLITSTQSDSQLKQQKTQLQKIDQHEDGQKADLTIIERSVEIASLEAKLDIQRQAYAKRPRIRRLTSVATKQADDALYLHHWREKIESVGNQNYPEKARQQQVFGELRLVVSLFSDGSVHKVQILESSGQKILDQAAIRIVHLAAPYDPFPANMRKNVDILEIIRTWRFHKNHLSSSS